jgi:hypothetical protein
MTKTFAIKLKPKFGGFTFDEARDRDMVQRACQEGWIVGLVDFVRDEHRLPYPEDRTELRQAANVVALSAAGETNLGIMHGPLVKLAQAMMARREKLIEEFAQ